MKLGLALAGDTMPRLAAEARAAEEVGIEIAWLPATPGADTALLRAAAVATATTTIRLAACVAVGGHPLQIAEAAAVADNCSNGRLILVLEDVDGDAELLAETVDVVLSAVAPRPFRHEGERWRIPANLPENDQPEERIIVTPQVVQPELPVWLAGGAAAAVARPRALAHVSRASDGVETARREWTATAVALGPAAARPRRPWLHDLDRAEFDPDPLVGRLRAEQVAWGMDVAVLSLPAGLDVDGWAAAARRIATAVRPRVLLDALPEGIERHWDDVLTR